MKTSIKFAALYFSLSIVFIIAAYIFFPNVYPGDSFTIIWFYVINFIIGIFLFPIFSSLIRRIHFKNKIGYLLAHFFSILVIINILPLLIEHVIYTIKVTYIIVKHPQILDSAMVEFANPIISFIITYYVFRKSELWNN
jgi:hypothetical protein